MAYSRLAAKEEGASSQIPPGTPRKRAGLWSRLSPLTVSLFSTVLSAVPFAIMYSGKVYDSNTTLYEITTRHRNSTQAVIKVLTVILGFLWGLSAFGAFNMFMRSRIATQEVVSMKHLELYLTLSSGGLNLRLSGLLSLLSLVWFGIVQLPGVLWTSALTPTQTTSTAYINDFPISQAGFEGQFIFEHNVGFTLPGLCDGQTRENGTFHNCPGSVFSGRIVDSIRTASSGANTTTPRSHAKFDKSGFNYLGRSYGAGSSAGLFDLRILGAIDSYSFLERGYVASSQCTYNSSSIWAFNQSRKAINDLPEPSIFHADGWRPNEVVGMQNRTQYASLSFEDYRRMVAFSAGGCCATPEGVPFRNGTPPFYLSITAALDYLLLNSTQCQLSFQPSMFNVKVSPVNQTIQVTPTQNLSGIAQGEFFEWTLLNLQTVSMTQTTLYESTIGDAFSENIDTKLNSDGDNGQLIKISSPPSSLALDALSDSVTAALDDIMQALNAYGLIKNGSWTRERVEVQLLVVEIGTKGWNIALLAFNLLTFAIVLSITTYTKLFYMSPAFNFADLPSMLAAVVCYFAEDHTSQNSSRFEDWRGDQQDVLLGQSKAVIDSELGEIKAPTLKIIAHNALEENTAE